MELLAALGHWPGAVWLQGSGTAYLFVNAAHILGIGLLIGAILPLDLRLMGLFAAVPLTVLVPFLSRAAGIGLGLALLTGFWLFTVRPVEYAANTAFLFKLGLIVLAFANIALQHAGTGLEEAMRTGGVPPKVRLLAAFSSMLWISALIAGRWIGFL